MSGRRPWWRDKTTVEARSNYVVSEAELFNRVLLAKALIAIAGNTTVHFRTGKEDLEITPIVARDFFRKAGRKLPARRRSTKGPSSINEA